MNENGEEGIEELLSGIDLDLSEYEKLERGEEKLSNLDEIGYENIDLDELNYVGSPDTEKWSAIVNKPEFRNPLDSLDHIFNSNDYSVEMHVDNSSFQQVEYENKPTPDRSTQ